MAIIVLGTSRRNGNTAQVVRYLVGADAGAGAIAGGHFADAEIIDLTDYSVAPYHYDQAYPPEDDFMALTERLLQHELIVLASPVYWYSVSGQLKIFLDRLSDLLTAHKETGRRLRGRRLGVISCANDAEVNGSFYAPLRLTAAYLGMGYGPVVHGWIAEGGRVSLDLHL